ncbi:M48 family metallopeptidase [Neobacillus niacini]|uniref:M48 family metallopeptidase n=1 Tax=Neobacillus niacini TaxID=86668 RepID=UPI0030008069
MTNEKFELLVRKLEIQSKKNPGLYRFKVLLFTGIGYGYILFFLALLLFLLTISILYMVDGNFTFGSLKALLFTGVLSFFIIKALIVKMEMPKGYYLKENEAPELEKTIEDLSKKLKTPKIHAIVLNTEYNAAVLQHLKFGLFGPKQNILLIGVPLLSSLTREQFTSVLAHELAHISHSDTAFGAMIYRVRRTWAQLMNSLETNEQFGTFLFRKFIKWFYPRFSAYTFVMARQQEYAADAAAAKVTSPEAVRDSLCTIYVRGQYFDRDFFDDLFDECSKTNKVPKPYSHFFRYAQKLNDSVLDAYLNEELAIESGVFDTHPCLLDRLKAVGMEPVIMKNKETAIEYFFANPDSILESFNQSWLEYNGEKWNEEIASFNDAKQRLEELETIKELDLHGQYEKALLTQDMIGPERAAAMLEEIISQYPPEAVVPAYLALGDIYLRKRATSERGEELLRYAMEITWECREKVLNMLCEYYYYTNQAEAFEDTRSQLAEWENTLKEYEEQIRSNSEEDHYVPHDKFAEEVAAAVEEISFHSEITEAYLVRRILDLIPERKNYILALKVQIPEDTAQEVYMNQLMEKYSNELHIFDDTYFYLLNGYEEFEKKVKAVDHSLIFSTVDIGKILQS